MSVTQSQYKSAANRRHAAKQKGSIMLMANTNSKRPRTPTKPVGVPIPGVSKESPLIQPPPDPLAYLAPEARFAMAIMVQLDMLTNTVRYAVKKSGDETGKLKEFLEVMENLDNCPLLDIINNWPTEGWCDDSLLELIKLA